MDSTTPTSGGPDRSRRTYTVTARIIVPADADQTDPFTRVTVFRALVDQLTTAPPDLDTPLGAARAEIGLATAVA